MVRREHAATNTRSICAQKLLASRKSDTPRRLSSAMSTFGYGRFIHIVRGHYRARKHTHNVL